MCKELPVIPVNRVVDKKKIIRKNGGEAQGVADPKMVLRPSCAVFWYRVGLQRLELMGIEIKSCQSTST
jgi:hypothetical protein